MSSTCGRAAAWPQVAAGAMPELDVTMTVGRRRVTASLTRCASDGAWSRAWVSGSLVASARTARRRLRRRGTGATATLLTRLDRSPAWAASSVECTSETRSTSLKLASSLRMCSVRMRSPRLAAYGSRWERRRTLTPAPRPASARMFRPCPQPRRRPDACRRTRRRR